MWLPTGWNAISPLLNSFFGLSKPDVTCASKYIPTEPNLCRLALIGTERNISPTVFGDKWRFSTQFIRNFPLISKNIGMLETEFLYNLSWFTSDYILAFMEKNILSDTNEEKYLEEHQVDTSTDQEQTIVDE